MKVILEDKSNYSGECSIQGATFETTFPKNICTKESNLKKLLENVSKIIQEGKYNLEEINQNAN